MVNKKSRNIKYSIAHSFSLGRCLKDSLKCLFRKDFANQNETEHQ